MSVLTTAGKNGPPKKVWTFNLLLEQTCRKDEVRPRTGMRLIEFKKEEQRAVRCDPNS